MSFYQTIVEGFVGQEPDLRYLPSGQAVCNTSIAHTKKWTKDGEKQEKTIWIHLSVWGESAESFKKYVTKGTGVLVIGEVEAKAYTDKQGNAAANLEMKVDKWLFSSAKKSGGAAAPSYDGIEDFAKEELGAVEF